MGTHIVNFYGDAFSLVIDLFPTAEETAQGKPKGDKHEKIKKPAILYS